MSMLSVHCATTCVLLITVKGLGDWGCLGGSQVSWSSPIVEAVTKGGRVQ